MISARVMLDSQNPYTGARLLTFELVYNRFIHSEFMTYRMLSRNSASSRAIPVKTMLKLLRETPAMPVYWGKNQSGMAAAEELDPEAIERCQGVWLEALEAQIWYVERLIEDGLHKQVANRLLEPWAHMATVATGNAQAFEHLYAQRIAPDAQPEFCELARQMWLAQCGSTPVARTEHFPYLFDDEPEALGQDAPKVSAARVARVSYMRQGLRKTLAEDLERYASLVASGHWSPLEHQAWASKIPCYSANFSDWLQYRQQVDTRSN